jgi:plasmid stabilization system protein ParE
VKVRLTAPARQQADRTDRWWRENRPAARGLFARELAEARALLSATPEAGSPYVERQGVLVRRLLLPKTHQHLYYEVDREKDAVMIIAVWGAPRGRGPTL